MRKKPTYLLLSLGILLLIIFAFIGIYSQTTKPIDITFQPEDGYATPWLQFSYQFSETVDHEAAESAILIEPQVSGSYTWDGNVVTFQSNNPLKYGETFTISITEFKDTINKFSLTESYTNKVTIREPNILFTSIKDGVISISDLHQNIFPLPSDTVILEIIPSFDGRYFVSLSQLSPGDTQVVVQFSQDRSVYSMYRCPEQSICSSLVAAPHSLDFLAYEYSRKTNQTTVILLDITAQTTSPILTVPGNLIEKPVWSNQGNQFAVFSPSEDKVIVINTDNGEQTEYQKEEVTLGAWSPDDTKIYNRHTHRDVTSTYSHLCILDLSTGEFSPIENDALPNGQYGAPVLIPGKSQLLFTKQAITGENTSQIWLYDITSNTAAPLTSEPSYTHGNLHVEVSGSYLVYQRFDVTKSDSTPEIWVWNLETGESSMIAAGASNPLWLQ